MARTYPDERLLALCETYLRQPIEAAKDSETGAPLFTFAPPLTAAEQVDFADLLAMARSHVTGLSLAEYQVLKPVLAGLRTYRGLSSPTNAQSVAAVKGIIDVLRAILTD